MKEILLKIIGIAVAIMIILTAFTFVRQNEIKGIIDEQEEKDFTITIVTDVASGTNPLNINFEPIILNNKGKVNYSWEFGDGNTTTENKPSYLYENSGEYVCRVIAFDEEGNKAEDFINISINQNKPPVVIISLNKNIHSRKFIPILSMLPLWPGDVQKIVNILENMNPYIFGEGSVVCTAQVDDPENDEIVSYEWVHQVETQLSQFGKPEQPTHNFSGNNTIKLPEIYTWPMGRHVVKLTVEDSVGNKADAQIEFQVEQSMKKIQRNQIKNLFKSAKNQWLLVLNPLVGVLVSSVLLMMWKYNNFEGVKLITLFLLTFVFQLDVGEAFIPQLKAYLDGHPAVLNLVDKLLISMQKIFVNQDIEAIREMLGLANNRPVISNPFPENGAKNIPIDCPYVAVNVSDLEGDSFNVTISGDYVNNMTYDNVTNGIYNATLITPLPDFTDITWKVEVIDQNGKIVTSDFKFKTFVEI